jgi:hypothetical protein
MNGIENKLKEDALVFKKKPSEHAKINIMKNIQDINMANTSKRTNWSHQWMIPVGVSAAALLFVVMNLSEPKMEKNSVESLVAINNKIQAINIDGLSLAFESQLMNSIKLEKEAILKDLDYMQSLFVL